MRKPPLHALPLALLALCAAFSLAAALPTLALLILNEFRRDSFSEPKPFDEIFPRSSSSPRIKRILEISATKPRGSVGMLYATYGRLRVAESANAGSGAHLALEAIVRKRGQPVRFEGRATRGVRWLIVFADEAPGFPTPPAETFEDMALVDLEGSAR